MLQKIVGGLVGLVLLAVLGGLGVVWWGLQPVSAGPSEAQTFVIPKGQSIQAIGERLAAAGLIKQPIFFRGYVVAQGIGNKIQAGSFELSSSLSLSELVTQLTQGTNDSWITLPEGWRREEVAEYLAQQGLPEFDEAEFLELSATSEGQLFPDTYLVPKLVTSQQMFSLLTNTFDQKITTGLASEIADSEYTLEEALIMASLVEREAANAAEMPMVAGVLWKRIEIGMPLQVDATLQYVKGYNKQTQNWWTPPLAVDKQLDSPFNTYANPGLPPRPISNPGLQAIKASLAPTQTDYLFYIHDTTGKVHFARTLDEHNSNVQRYLR